MSEQSGPTAQPGQYMAAIDMGSNSFHMVLARLEAGEVRVVQKLGDKVMLAAGLDERNELSAETMDRGIAALRRFAQCADNIDPRWIRCVGTNTLRRARNAEQFLARVRDLLHCPVEVVAGREEARLIYLGVSHSLPDSGGRRLVFDIGGGSTEFIIGVRFDAMLTESLHMGCVEYRDRFFARGALGTRQFDRAVTAARREIVSIESQYRRKGWDSVVGSSGSVRAVESVAQACGYATQGVTLEAMYRIRERLLKFKSLEGIDLPGLKEDRRSTFPAGLAILIAICEQLGIERFSTSEGAMREGILYDMLGRHDPEDVRERSVRSLLARYSVDTAQAGRVMETALEAFDQVAQAWKLNAGEWRDLLGWASETHELGLAISHAGYHKHGAYVLQHSDLAGFTRHEQRVLSTIVGCHRRKIRDTHFELLPDIMRSPVAKLTLLLRFAVVLHHGRREDVMPLFTFRIDGRKTTVEFAKGWLDDHPLTAEGLVEEQSVWSKFGIELRVS